MRQENFWRDRKVFVTGATGLLGSWLITELVSQEAEVIALVRDELAFSILYDNNLKSKITIVRGCVEDAEFITRVINEYEIETVFHLAAQAIVNTALREPISTFKSNIAGTWCLLEASRRVKTVGRIVVASSDKVYGDQPVLPYTEDMPLLARIPYDVSKVCTDLLAQSYAVTYELPIVIARCGNLFGGGDFNWNRIIPGTIRAALRGVSPVIRTDGTLIRDYFFVKDAVTAYLQLAQQAHRNELRGRAYNFGEGCPMSVLEICKKTLEATDRPDLKIIVEGRATSEIRQQWLDSTRARQELDWKPVYGLEAGLKQTVDWYRAYFANKNRRIK